MFRDFFRDERGSVGVIGALSLTAVIGFAALAVELGQGYANRVDNQRVADMVAVGAALAYSSNQTQTVLDATAASIAAANGISATELLTELIDSPAGGGGKAVRVTVTTPLVLRLARVFTSTASINISAQAIASLNGGGTACIMALSKVASNGISANGGTSVTANCTIAANSNISTVGGAKIVGKTVRSGGTVSSSGGSSVTTAPTANQITQNVANAAVDPLSGSSDLTSAYALLGTYTTVAINSVPTGTDFTLDYSPNASVSSYWNSGTATYTFPAGTYNIRNLKLNGGIKAVFQGPSTITVSGSIDHGGSALTFGDGTVTVIGETKVGGGTTFNIGAGRHYFGNITVGGGSTMTVGAGDVDVNGAIDLQGGATLTFGAGNAALGAGASGSTKDMSIVMSGSSTLTFGNGTFSTKGSISTAGGSKLTFGETANHLINGNLDIKGAALFGKGRYTINGNFTDGTGGTTWPSGTMLNGVNIGGYDLAGIDVTFITAGKLDLSGGAKVYLTAPSTSTFGGIADILIAHKDGSDFSFGGGSASIMAGVIYAPKSAVQMSGGATLSSGTGCFMLIGDTITMKGGSAGATICPNMGSGGATTILLLQ